MNGIRDKGGTQIPPTYASRLPIRTENPVAQPRDTASISAVPKLGSAPLAVARALNLSLLASVRLAAAPAATAAMSDPDCLRLMQDLQAHGVEFRKNRWHIPLIMDKTRHAEPQEVLDTMHQSRQDKLHVHPPASDLVPLRDQEDLHELSAFYSDGDFKSLSHPNLASLLHDVEVDGNEIRDGATSRTRIGRYGAYNALTGRASAPPGAAPWAWRDGIPMMSLPADAGLRSVEVRGEMRQCREALRDLQGKTAAGDKDAIRDLELLSRPVGNTSFARRAAILQKFAENKEHSDARVDYTLVSRSLREGENFEDVARFLSTLSGQGDGHRAFNYMRNHLWHEPVLVESFQRVYKETSDINVAVNAMTVLTQPVTGENYAEREACLLRLARLERDVASYGSYGLVGDRALDDYSYVARDTRQGERFTQVVDDYASVLQGVKESSADANQARPTFRYLRDDLAGDAVRQGYFRNIARTVGSVEEAKQAMVFIEQPNGSPDRDVRAEVLTGLLKSTHQLAEASRIYGEIATALQPGESFQQAGKLMANLMGDLDVDRYRDRVGLREAYDYARTELKGDADAVERFRQVARVRHDGHDAVRIYPVLRAPVHGETEEKRVEQFLRLQNCMNTYNNRDALPMYQAVSTHLLDGESLEEGAAQMEALVKGISADRTAQSPEQAYIDLKQRHANNPDEIRVFTRLLNGLESYQAAEQSRHLMDQSVVGENFADREDVFFQILEQEKSLNRDRKGAVEDYQALSTNLVAGENLSEGVSRFSALLMACNGKTASADARDAFAFIADHFKKGNFAPGRTAAEVTAVLVESLLLNGDLNAAKNRSLTDPHKSGSVERNDDYVIIGGLKVPRHH